MNCQNNRKKIGIMGGTFDPIHMGHLILGEQSYEQFQLDKVLFMPSGNPPHKRDRAGRASDNQRVDMVRLAIEDNPHFELSLAEMHETGYTYTYRTLEELKEYNPDTDYYFIIGADSLFAFDEWMEPERICRACTLVVAVRDHASYAFAKIEKKLSKYLDEDRFQHTMGVMYTSACLAMVHGYDIKDAQVSGLLHDCAKCIPNKKKLKMCSEHNIPVSDFERSHPFLLHSRLGAYIAHEKYGIDDQEILSAINYHTTGRREMSLLEKIIYIADYIEPMRYKASRLPEIRKLAFEDLDECMYEILKDTLEYLEEDSADDIEPTSKEAYIYYKELHNKRNNVSDN